MPCHKRSLEKSASRLSITPSPFPPSLGESSSARARKPFGCPDGSWDVKLPNSSLPLSIVPFPFRSNARNASSDLGAVQAVRSVVPSLLRSNSTPPLGSVRSNPLPSISIRTGLPRHVGHGIVGSPPSPIRNGGASIQASGLEKSNTSFTMFSQPASVGMSRHYLIIGDDRGQHLSR